MRIGHGSTILDVPDGTPMGGYEAREATSRGVLAPLQVDCVSIESDGRRLLLVVAELVGVNTDLADDVRTRVLRVLGPDAPTTDVWISATHTHSGPEVGLRPGGGPTPEHWREAVTAAAVEAGLEAVRSEETRAAAHHVGDVEGIGSRRSDGSGDAVVPVDVITIGGDPVDGVLVVVPVHPTVLPATSTLVSGDLTAWIRDELHARLGDSGRSRRPPWIVVATGAAGDISTRWVRTAQTTAEGRRIAATAAEQIAGLVSSAGVDVSNGPVVQARRRLDLPIRHDDGAWLDQMRAQLTNALTEAVPGDAAARSAVTALQGVKVASRRASDDHGDRVPIELSAARLGGLSLVGIGGEPFLSLRGDLEERLGPRVVLLGYTNGYAGYVPDAPAFDHAGYEVLVSPFDRDAAARVVAALHDLSAHLAPEARP